MIKVLVLYVGLGMENQGILCSCARRATSDLAALAGLDEGNNSSS